MTALVVVQSIEDILAQAEPGAVGVVEAHQARPHRHRQAEESLFLPGDLGYLQATGYGFTIPAGATIQGIEPAVERRFAAFFGTLTSFLIDHLPITVHYSEPPTHLTAKFNRVARVTAGLARTPRLLARAQALPRLSCNIIRPGSLT